MIDWKLFNPQKGCFLLSEPTLPDANFSRTVSLLVEHSDQSSLAFVLNRPLNIRVADLDESFSHIDLPLFEGGPVELNTLHYLHQLADVPGAEEIVQGVFWGGEFESILIRASELNKSNSRFFLGYSGWASGQLNSEVESSSWIITDATSEFVFNSNIETLWENILQSEGGEIAKLASYPRDPSWN